MNVYAYLPTDLLMMNLITCNMLYAETRSSLNVLGGFLNHSSTRAGYIVRP